MKINLLDVNKFIKENDCQEVTDPVMFNAGVTPSDNGLFSEIIFGEIGSRDRATKFGYINLKDKFIHPIIYRLLISIEKDTENILMGNKFVSLDKNGYIVEDEQNGSGGIDFFYNNWEKLAFRISESEIRKTKLNILKKMPKELVFMDKIMVLPAGLRDFNKGKNTSGVADYDEINDTYSRIIRLASSLQGSTFSFVNTTTKFQIQKLITSIYERLVLHDLAGKPSKYGLFRKALMGKSIDYAVRSVITTPNKYSMSYKDLEVPFGYTGVPLSQIIVLFYPFFVKYIKDFISIHIDSFRYVKDGKNEIEIPNVVEQFTDDNIKKMLDRYIRDIEGRFSSIKVKAPNGKYYPVNLFSKELNRNFTVTDLLFIASVSITEDKHVYCSRYPIENFQNIYPSKIKVLSTTKVMTVSIENHILKNYPTVYPDYPVKDTVFLDAVKTNDSYLAALGGDYDGDQMSIRAVFTNEANAEADKLIKSKTMILNQSGVNVRKLGNDGLLALYSLTKD